MLTQAVLDLSTRTSASQVLRLQVRTLHLGLSFIHNVLFVVKRIKVYIMSSLEKVFLVEPAPVWWPANHRNHHLSVVTDACAQLFGF